MALKPLEALAKTRQPLAVFADAHRQVIDALSKERRDEGVAFSGPDGTALDRAFLEITDHAQDAVAVSASEYPDLFRAIVAEKSVRRPDRPGVRVRIYGLLEARLQSIDRVVLGGLVEGVWPPETRSDPWLSRPMRRSLGLDLPERRISLSAHDFAQMLGANEVVLAYPAKLSGAPTVPSRFIQRLAAVAGEERWNAALARGETYLDWARGLDRPLDPPRPVPRPEPKPARDARPTSLSVTEIETWLRDPYSIYARHILRLQPLDAIDTPPGARDRGTVIHGAIGDVHVKLQGCPAQQRPRRTDQARRDGIRRARGFSRGARVLVAALSPHRALVRRFRGADAASMSRRSARRSAPSWRFRSAVAPSPCARAPTASSICATEATRSSTTRPAGRRPRPRCRPG